jgi:hypothetical protein
VSIVITPANIATGQAAITDLFKRSLNPLYDKRRFQWLYCQCPFGPPRVYSAVNEESGEVIGIASVFMRCMYVNNQEYAAWVLGDFCLDPQYRSLGPALQLQRACLGILEGNQRTFCYDFPSSSMAAVYIRLGFNVTGTMLRLAKPLRVDRKVREIIRNPAAQRLVSCVGNTLLKIASPKPNTGESFEVSFHQGPCGDEFTTVAEKQRDNFWISLRRSAEYLNWRYVENPLARHEIITARRNGRLVGYIVLAQAGEDASIVDLFGAEDLRMMRRLITEVVNLAQKHGAITLSVTINESHPWRFLFSEMGFRVRDSAPVMIIPSKTFPYKIDPQLTGWYLMQGDRDS